MRVTRFPAPREPKWVPSRKRYLLNTQYSHMEQSNPNLLRCKLYKLLDRLNDWMRNDIRYTLPVHVLAYNYIMPSVVALGRITPALRVKYGWDAYFTRIAGVIGTRKK